MRKRIIVLLILLLLIGTMQLTADTIIDSVYATPELDGDILFRQSIQSFIVFDWYYAMCSGDLGVSVIEPDPNSRFRAYVSFELPQIPTGYQLDSVYVRLYQYYSMGNDVENEFPVWDVPGGDTMYCIMDHINYGNELDVTDWIKGDPGELGTLHTNIGIISESGEDGYRYCDITDYVLDDYHNGRDKTQYRLRHPIETDWDSRYDIVNFLTSFEDPEHDPLIVLYFKSNNSIGEDIPDVHSIVLYPNPVRDYFTIEFAISNLRRKQLSLYNVRGERIKRICASSVSNSFTVGTANVPSGVYFVRIDNEDVTFTRKILVIK